MLDSDDFIGAIRSVADTWADPDHAPRAAAEAETLGAPNLFTEASVVFAVNQAMDALRAASFESVVASGAPEVARLWIEGATPMAGYADVIGSLLAGSRVEARLGEASPALLPAFVRALEAEVGALPVTWEGGGEEARRAETGQAFGVAVVDGSESGADWEGVAEDALLYEGGGAQSTRIVLAPDALKPDALLEACSLFRAVAGVHADLPGRLALPKAFLQAAGTPHAFGDDLAFLISRGAFEPQPAGHIRWVPYASRAEAERLLAEHSAEISAVTTRLGLPLTVPTALPRRAHGEAHRRSFAEAFSL